MFKIGKKYKFSVEKMKEVQPDIYNRDNEFYDSYDGREPESFESPWCAHIDLYPFDCTYFVEID